MSGSREPRPRRLRLRFAVKYCAMAALLFTIYAFPFELFGARQDWLTGYLAAYARMAGALLWIFDRGVVVTDTFINGRFPLQIVRNCDAIEINILFASAVLAFPAPWARRIPVLLLGLLGLVAVNVLRICCLYFVGVYRPDWFSTAHEEVWPLLLVAIAVAAFWFAASHLQPETAYGEQPSDG